MNWSWKKHLLMLCLITVLFSDCTRTENHNADRNRVTPFELSDVTLLDGPFKHATDLSKKSLLQYEPDRFLARFRREAGLEFKAEAYGGWEAETIAGHSLGHYLSGCALMYGSTGDEQFRQRVAYIVDELDACQQADGEGYIGAIPNGKAILMQVAHGDIRSQGFDLNGLWAPFYTHHKVLAGLRDAYHLCGVEKALEIEENFADWISGIVGHLDDAQVQNMLNCEHGGMNEVLVDLYVDTQDEKYLNMSRIFHHKAMLDSLAMGFDILPGKHGNTQIPKLIGLAKRYEVTGDQQDKKAAEFFWERVVRHHSYVTGGHGNHEYFGQPDQLRHRLSDETTETCNVYNMLKLSRHLFQWHPDAEIADFYERALFNHILSSQHPENGRVIYNLSLEMGGFKVYQDPEWFTCCIGTGMESHSKYGQNIFFKNKDELYVSQFIAASVKWQDKGLIVTQKTNFPEEQGTTIEMICDHPQKLTLYIRYPYWAQNGIDISVNGQRQKIKQKAPSFIGITRVWQSGDVVNVNLPFSLRLEPMPDDENRVALLYGPLVLAGDLGPVDDPAAETHDYVPVLFAGDRHPQHWLVPIEHSMNAFKIDDGFARPRTFSLSPFYATHDRRYSVYWDIFDEARWNQYQADYEAEQIRKKELEEKTIDFFQPGEMQAERDHAFHGERIRVMDFQHKKARVADRGGWFSFELMAQPERDIALVVHYWGGFTGSKTFDILVNGEKIATENISGKKDGEFIDVQYDFDSALVAENQKIQVRFEPHDGHRAGPIFGARTIVR